MLDLAINLDLAPESPWRNADTQRAFEEGIEMCMCGKAVGQDCPLMADNGCLPLPNMLENQDYERHRTG